MIEVGNVVRYLGTEPKGWLTRGGLAKVIQVSKAGRLRLCGKGGSPQYVEHDQVELVSVTDERGIFDRKPRGSGYVVKPEPVTEIPEPQPDPEPIRSAIDATDARIIEALRMWPHFDDGTLVMLGDFVSAEGQTDQVALISIDADGYELAGYAISIELAFGETVQHGHDSIDLIWAAACDAMVTDKLSRGLFEQLVERAAKLGGAS